ncbi:MAG TPA: hypothetical protein VKA77_06230, partial [Mycobacterium sp.]|nr:hypothetical protein [Mycobacterium sp.]
MPASTPVTGSVADAGNEQENASVDRFAIATPGLDDDAALATALSTASRATASSPLVDPVASLLAIPGTAITVAIGLIAAVTAPFLAPGPAAPADPPLLLAVLAWARRQFAKGFADNASVVNPVQTTEIEPSLEANLAAADVSAAAPPAEFERTAVVSGLNGPVDFAFLPDGRILIGEKGGAIKIYHDGHVHTAITLAATTAGERGI